MFSVTASCKFIHLPHFKSVFACVSAPVHSFVRFLHAVLWIWLHLLQCNVSNQYRSVLEDAVNRPWRPLPSRLISVEHACILRWLLVPLCIGTSLCYGWDVALASACLTLTTVCYDELGLAGHFLGKNLCNVPGYVSFEIGATKIMGKINRGIGTLSLQVSRCMQVLPRTSTSLL